MTSAGSVIRETLIHYQNEGYGPSVSAEALVALDALLEQNLKMRMKIDRQRLVLAKYERHLAQQKKERNEP